MIWHLVWRQLQKAAGMGIWNWGVPYSFWWSHLSTNETVQWWPLDALLKSNTLRVLGTHTAASCSCWLIFRRIHANSTRVWFCSGHLQSKQLPVSMLINWGLFWSTLSVVIHAYLWRSHGPQQLICLQQPQGRSNLICSFTPFCNWSWYQPFLFGCYFCVCYPLHALLLT